MTQTDPLCPRTELPASMCSHCRGLPWDPPEDLAEAVDSKRRELQAAGLSDPAPARGIFAERDSECPGCGEPIRPGDLIVRDGRRYVCAECAENDEALR